MSNKFETVVIGGGQAGLAMSYYLKQQGKDHVVLDQAAQPGNAWRNGRWDSFTLVTPNWSVQLPGAEYQGNSPYDFMSRDEVVAYIEDYVERFNLPVKFKARATEVKAHSNGNGSRYLVRTDDEVFEASNVVVATGLFQQPNLPEFSSEIPERIDQMHSSQYRNPESLKSGAVLVVGTGQSGAQIAEELYKSGRVVYLCVGSAGRGPRRYRGKDIYDWLTMLPERTVDELPSPRAKFTGSPHVSGTKGGHSLNLHQFARDGVNLLGRLQGVEGEVITLKPDLKENLEKVDTFEQELLKMIDGFIAEASLDAPEEEPVQLHDGYEVDEITELDLKVTDITTIIWATGYKFDFGMVKLSAFDEDGYPIQKRGVTEYPGMYFLGLPWLYKQQSGLLVGVGDDAEYLASQIAT
jgi:putative flavoprotein involved in K+ transport